MYRAPLADRWRIAGARDAWSAGNPALSAYSAAVSHHSLADDGVVNSKN
jgi:hypothetical protein